MGCINGTWAASDKTTFVWQCWSCAFVRVHQGPNQFLLVYHRSGFAPFNPKHLIPAAELEDADPNEVLVVTTGSQAEPRAALSLASRGASFSLKLTQDDLILYSAKV